jgi:L-threonylcarbamoyladenylate synthase
VSPTTAAHVRADLDGRIDLIVDGGPTPVGIESSIVCCLGAPVLLRPGGLPRAEIERALGRAIGQPSPAAVGSPRAPGMLASHYAPRTPLRINAVSVGRGEGLLAFGPTPPPGADGAAALLNLSPRGDLVEAAANLFSYLRRLDGQGLSTIAVVPISPEGLGEAINDRLARAAAPRD